MNADNNKANRFIDSLKAKYGSKVEDLRSILEEFSDNSQDVLDKVIEIVKDENVQQGLSAVAIIGPVFKLGLSIYDVVSKHSKSHDSYFAFKESINLFALLLSILKLRFAKGEISKQDYEEMKKIIEQN